MNERSVWERYRFGPFFLDAGERRLWRDSTEVLLTPKAFDVLMCLVRNAGRVVERDALLEAVWPGTYVDDHALSVQVGEVRKALDDRPGEPRYIETRHRRGYRFVAPVEAVTREASPAPTGKAQRPVNPPSVMAFSPPVTHYARSGNVNIAYQVLGEGPLDLVFVMGWVSHIEYFWKEPHFARFLNRLASFSRLILFDKRGTGLSDRVPLANLPTLEERMDDLRSVMEAVGSRRAVLCGVSEGGPMSALFAATHPDKTVALVMIGTYARRLRADDYPWGPSPEERDSFLEQIRRHWGGPVGIQERAPSLKDSPEFREWWSTYLRMGASPGAAVALTQMNAEIDVRPVLPSVRVPALVLHREGDQCLEAAEGRYVAQLIPGAKFVLLPGRDHLPFVGDQDEMLDEIDDFLASLRFKLEPERVLATVLVVGSGPVSAGAEDDIARELEWFRGRPMEARQYVLRATFDGPARAVRCALAILRHAARLGHRLSAAVHTGECDIFEDKVIGGPAVEQAERILDSTPPGEILASSTVCHLVAGSGIRFTGTLEDGPDEVTAYRVER
jgi:pimeloyl-ACP methyl ester carboxylesterase/DNA-binding winged helix-turn-helix (wHTH) protein